MRLLLDTHTFLWLVQGNPKLSSAAISAIVDPQNELFLSVASIWELTIKAAIGKLLLTDPIGVLVDRWVAACGIQVLNIEKPHVLGVAALPLHHRDPFDRLLIAQAVHEQLTFVSGDAQVRGYVAPILW